MKSPIQRQMELFSAALEHPAGPERDAFLVRACAGDDALLDCVRTLLAGHSQAGSFLAQLARPVGPTGTHLLPSTEQPGDKIGRYKLLQQIGEGGCGTVYMAEQEEPVRRRVALKVIRLGMDTKSVIARFEAERQALALMDHPNIAKIYDGGVTGDPSTRSADLRSAVSPTSSRQAAPQDQSVGPSEAPQAGSAAIQQTGSLRYEAGTAATTSVGRPYFVMELVRGIKITEYCDQAHLSTGERLQLFIQVCQAVQHAHQKGIIHRDIKPSNILVTVNDGVAVPKVIDFGIAKATDQRLTDKTYFTEFHAFIGTPAYTSPEQAEMSSLDIDTRSDIYSLGVLLYELLTGQTPFPAERLLHSGLDEMRRIIREEEPPRPSTRLTTLALADATDLSQRRQAKIPQLASAVQGDLDWIVMKALEKDRTRRYATSLDFAADLQRHLDNEPVHAGAPSSLYKFQKLVRRNKGAFAAAAAVFLALLTGLGLTAWQAVRAKNAEQAARSAEYAARADRDRAVLAESNATEKATQATNALLTANERMVKLNVAEGWRRVEEGDHFGALLPFAEAFALEQDKPDRAEIHQTRLASVLQRSPKLVNVWSVGTNINLNHVKFSRDGSRLVASWETQKPYLESAGIWETATGRLLIEPADAAEKTHAHWIACSGDEKKFVTISHLRDRIQGKDGKPTAAMRAGIRYVQVWDAATGRPVSPPFRFDADNSIHYATMNPDGSQFLLAKYATHFVPDQGMKYDLPAELSLWDAATGTNLWLHTNESYPLLLESESVTFSPDGSSLVSGWGILDVRTGKIIATNAAALFAEFSADGKRLFTAARKGWQSWAILRKGNSVTQTICEWRQGAIPDSGGRFSRDGKKLATANSDSSVRIWNALDGSPHTSPMEHGSMVSDVCFSSDGAWVATCIGKRSDEGYAQVWDATTGKPITPQLPHDGPVLRVAFNQDDTQLYVIGENGTVAVWSLTSFNVPRFTWFVPGLRGNYNRVFPRSGKVELAEDGKALLCKYTSNSTVMVWNLVNGELFLPSMSILENVNMTGTNLIMGGHSGKWSVVNLESGNKLNHSIADHFKTTNFIRAEQASAGGRWLTAQQDGGNELLVVDAISGSVTARSEHDGLSDFLDRVIRQDGNQVLAVQRGNNVKEGKIACWNIGNSTAPELLNTQGWRPVGYSRSGQMVTLEHDEKSGTRVLETQFFREVLDTNWIVENISSNDTWILAETSEDERWQIHCATNATIKSPILTHRGTIVCGVFTADGAIAITAGKDLALRFWRVPNAEAAALPVALSSEATQLLGTSDGRGFVTVHDDDTLRFWELPKRKRPVTEWLALARLFTYGHGKSSDNAGKSSVPLKTNSFRDEWLALRAKHPEVFTVSTDEIDAWHRHESWRCESTKDWSNAVHHLTELLKTQPDSGDFLPRRAAAHVAWAESLISLAPGFNPVKTSDATTSAASAASRPPEAVKTAPDLAAQNTGLKPGANEITMTSRIAATNHWESALADYTRTLAWVDRYPAIAKESRKPFVEKRREVYLKLGRQTEADADERELKAGVPK